MAEDDPGTERARVLMHLNDKIIALDRHEAELIRLDGEEEDPDIREQLSQQRNETIIERELCQARYDQIFANAPFSNPGEAAENELLNAIQQADILIQTSAGAVALMAAFHRVVVAYSGART